MRDFEEPTTMPSSPRASGSIPARPSQGQGSPPKSLSRMSCPPSLHGTLTFSSRHSGDTPSILNTPSSPIPSLGRTSMGSPRQTASPRSPPKTSPFATSAPTGGLFSKLLEKGDDEDEKCQWSSRVESSALNQRPDQPPDLDEWRHGSFKVEDTLHTMHILNCDPSSPKKEGCRPEGE